MLMAQLRAKLANDKADVADWKLRLVRSMYDRGFAQADILELLGIIDWMITLPPDLEARYEGQVYALEQEKDKPYMTSFERKALERGHIEGI